LGRRYEGEALLFISKHQRESNSHVEDGQSMMFRSSFTPFFLIRVNQPFTINKRAASQSSSVYSLITG
jgi:hypothetical protein